MTGKILIRRSPLCHRFVFADSIGAEATMNDQTVEKKLGPVWWTLRIALGAGPFLAGLDKFFNLLTDWSM